MQDNADNVKQCKTMQNNARQCRQCKTMQTIQYNAKQCRQYTTMQDNARIIMIIIICDMTGVTCCELVCFRGGSELVKKTAHVEVPGISVQLTKPQYLLLLYILNSWSVSLTGSDKISPASQALMNSVFHTSGEL